MALTQPIHVGGLLVGLAALVFVLIGLAAPGWAAGRIQGIKASLGLFTLCVPFGCASLGDIPGWMYGARALVIIAFLCCIGGVATAVAFYVKFAKKNLPNPQLPLISSVLFFVAGVLALIGAIIFATNVGSIGTVQLGYAFALTIVGAVAALVAGALIMVQRSKAPPS